MKTTQLYKALNTMRQLSKGNVPFSISFVSYSQSSHSTNGHKTVNNVVLRTGLSKDHSDKAISLIGYTELETGNHRWFYLPLLTKLNDTPI